MYRVLYRKWRPQVFGDVVGQPHITRTLSAEVRENRLAHAYLFTGSRGTGKTTCAKILSKAVNCLHPVNGDPCNECEICRGIDRGSVLDVVEIDAASNRGIDDIRQLRDESNFTPAQAKYRVYIIDEVHMLTIEAFNALLKTLEEPPEHVKFILATTEVHKLPSTILSRCQRFDFRRIEPRVIADRLLYVAGAEGVKLHEDAAMLIARVADGGMRDALSLLDSCMSVSEEITTEVVSACAGLMGRDYIYALVRAVAAGDAAACLTLLDELHNASCDTERLLSELTNQFRNFLIIKTVRRPEELIVCTADELGTLKELAALFTDEHILYALNVLAKTTETVKRTTSRRIEAEMALIRICSPETDTDVSALNARIAALEAALASVQAGGALPVKAPAPAKPAPAPVREAPAPAEPFAGFGQESASGGYASLFSAEEDDDEPIAVFDEAPPQAEDDPFAGFAEASDEAPPQAEDDPFAGSTDDGVPAGKDENFDFDAFMREHTPKNAKPAAPAPKPQPAPVQTEASPGNGPVNRREWAGVVVELERACRPLTGQLAGSSARVAGDALIVRLADEKIKLFFNESLALQQLSPIVQQRLGRLYNIRFE